MPRKKLTSSTQQQATSNQDAINGAADQLVGAFKSTVLNRAEEQLYDFFLGGGFQSELAGRLNPILTEFTNSLGLPASNSDSSSVGLISADDCVFDVEAQDV